MFWVLLPLILRSGSTPPQNQVNPIGHEELFEVLVCPRAFFCPLNPV
jgi:hypothetical protein